MYLCQGYPDWTQLADPEQKVYVCRPGFHTETDDSVAGAASVVVAGIQVVRSNPTKPEGAFVIRFPSLPLEIAWPL